MHIGVVVKVSKLCNLRCTYCYETPELANRERMQIGQIEKMFVHLRDYLWFWKNRTPYQQLIFYWHGGEPFAQPLSYWQQILEVQENIFGEAFIRQSIVNAVQTNLTLITEKHLPLLRQMHVGFSYDVINDRRLTTGGRPTNALVRKTVEMLLSYGISISGIAVISKINVGAPAQIARYFIDRNISFRTIPIDEGLDNIPQIIEDAVPYGAYLEFLRKLYELPEVRYAMQSIMIDPLTLAKNKWESSQRSRPSFISERDCVESEYLLEVNTNGDVYSYGDYPYRDPYGNIFNQTIDELLASEGRRKRIARSAERISKICSNCSLFRKSCNGTFVSHATAEQYRDFERYGGCYLTFIAGLMDQTDREAQIRIAFAYQEAVAE